jgi:quercetin dioxygenase-like cupin family protein
VYMLGPLRSALPLREFFFICSEESYMSVFHLNDFQDVPNRPGRRARDLAGSVHGFDSLFVTENEMDHGSTIPLHTHPVEEGWVVLEGELSVRIGDEWVTVPAGSVARVPPGVPHAVRNEGDAQCGRLRPLRGRGTASTPRLQPTSMSTKFVPVSSGAA